MLFPAAVIVNLVIVGQVTIIWKSIWILCSLFPVIDVLWGRKGCLVSC